MEAEGDQYLDLVTSLTKTRGTLAENKEGKKKKKLRGKRNRLGSPSTGLCLDCMVLSPPPLHWQASYSPAVLTTWF
jgi:hypothetical protein